MAKLLVTGCRESETLSQQPLRSGKGRTGMFERGTLEPTVLVRVGDVLRYAGRKALLQVGMG